MTTTIPDEEAELKRLGIRRVATEQFQVGGYRYTNLGDAIAEAKRAPAPDNDR
jgi:hypothetical protein